MPPAQPGEQPTGMSAYTRACAAAGIPVDKHVEVAIRLGEGTRLQLSNLSLSDAAAVCVAEAVRATASLSNVEFTDVSMPATAARELGAAVASLSTVQRLSMGNAGLGDDGVFSLLPLLRCGSLVHLDLRANAIGNSGASAIAEALATQVSMRTLDLQRNNIKCQGTIALAAALQVAEGLQVVNLRFNEISDSGATALGKALQSNRSIAELHLGGNMICNDGAAQLASSLVHNRSLTTLNLRSNAIQDAGAVAIAQMLKRNDTLVNLFLGANSIGEEGTLALTDALRTNARLQKVDLQGAVVGTVAAASLAEALKVNRCLKQLVVELDPGNAAAAAAAAAAIANALRSNTTITELSLGDGARLDEAVATAISGTLRVNRFINTIGSGHTHPPTTAPASASVSAVSPLSSTRSPPASTRSPPVATHEVPPAAAAGARAESLGVAMGMSAVSPPASFGARRDGVGVGVSGSGGGVSVGVGVGGVSGGGSGGGVGGVGRVAPQAGAARSASFGRQAGRVAARTDGTPGTSRTPAGSRGGSERSQGRAAAEAEARAESEAALLSGVNGRMEQLAAAMELRLQAQEEQMQRLTHTLQADRSRSTELNGELSELSARLQHAASQDAAARVQLERMQSTVQSLETQLHQAQQAAAKERAHANQRIQALADALQVASDEREAQAAASQRTIKGLETQLAEMQEALTTQVSSLRTESEAGLAREVARREEQQSELSKAMEAAQLKMGSDLRWIDEEHLRCRGEDEAKVKQLIGAAREELEGRMERLQLELHEGRVADDQPSALQLLQQTVGRVEALGSAVQRLCAHMESLKVKEVSAMAEERVVQLEARMSAAQEVQLQQAQEDVIRRVEQLTARLHHLEAAVQQEQQSSLKALQAILHSTHA